MTTITEFVVSEELDTFRKCAEVLDWEIKEVDPITFVVGFQSGKGQEFWCKVICENYKQNPPFWHWYNPTTKLIDQSNDIPQIEGGSIRGYFHSSGIICAPWNRLAYKSISQPNGLHPEWVLSDWITNPKTGICTTLTGMAIQVHQELSSNV